MVGNHVPPGKFNVKRSESAQILDEPISQTRNLCRPVQGGLPQSNRSSMTISALPTHSQDSPSSDCSSLHVKK